MMILITVITMMKASASQARCVWIVSKCCWPHDNIVLPIELMHISEALCFPVLPGFVLRAVRIEFDRLTTAARAGLWWSVHACLESASHDILGSRLLPTTAICSYRV